MILDNKKLIFIHIPKNAGIFINYSLGHDAKSGDWTENHSGCKIFLKNHPKKFKEYYKFCIVRHPVKRMESWFYFHREHFKNTNNSIYYNFDSFEHWVEHNMPYHEDWNKCGVRSPLKQYQFVTNENKEILVNRVCKIENLKNDLNKVCEDTGLDPNIFNGKKVNKTENKVEKRYPKNITDIIYNTLQHDYEIFNYNPTEFTI